MAQSTLSQLFTVQESRNLQSMYNTGELEGVILQIKSKSDNLDNVQLNIAVLGDVGSGKSTFINAMRGLRSSDHGAAPTGNEETWMEPTKYPCQDLPNVQLWDLPGMNSFGFELNNYLKKVKFESFDFFIIVSQARFRENDGEIAKKIQEQGKEFYYVRSKIDNDAYSLKKQGADLNEGWRTIRRDCINNFQTVGVTPPDIFLISSFDLEEYDFLRLKSTLTRDLPSIKSNVLSLSVPKIMLDVTEPKRRMLMKRVWLLAILAGAVGAVPVSVPVPMSVPVPVPVLSVITIIGLTVAGRIYLQKQLGLSDKLLQSLASKVAKPSSVLKAEMNHRLPRKMPLAVTNVLLGITIVTCMITGIKYSFSPVMLSIFGAVSSFALTYKLLKDSLKDHLETVQCLVKSALSRD
ncbi:T-cell-specific guanine nucleotide triphosphate-binding protein 2-like [Carcharodon carcharias]|uniref:T-cell-specific guanine nucleotide triphosphate-binding protein 2-like n=1 Tax=Carcharodon carcharias TaxID=13397 RepID=UPI001B7E9E49|nr:T-cell-specific guanine nucleotide triphosphate-binding protein 2-like [Carcharodon carcharias]XP_041052013.1 T-cell-specific guanine nucleotide triphosphate-binding protein 2-like [Carcharodon carcharias]XP_041052014.1 T-cell-specific guanine nucleotide triphosphate-binding protein 2-like [Carcharodon carcharias]XP_041052015.1 T-cell-specific guanine nucleotide triphosphate-binding protein 2-like [Carcharodon carcharias]